MTNILQFCRTTKKDGGVVQYEYRLMAHETITIAYHPNKGWTGWLTFESGHTTSLKGLFPNIMSVKDQLLEQATC